MSDGFEARIANYLSAKLEGVQDVQVSNLSRIHGGASCETYRLRARYHESGRLVDRGLILRRDPPSGLIETERATEFAAYNAFQNSPVPVPEVFWLENDPQWLDRPFFVMAEVENCAAGSILAADPYGAHAEKIGAQFWTALGQIAASPPERLAGAKIAIPQSRDCWRVELAKWEQVIDEDEREPQPVARAAIRWMKRHPPPPPQRLCVVHGDYRTGNFLFDVEGNVRAILDWEMVHAGDPHEDLGWALDPLWSPHLPGRPGGMIAPRDAIKFWEKASGLKVDRVALTWWRMFAMVKGLAIWISAGAEYQDGKNVDPVMAFSSWYCTAMHNRALADALMRDGRGLT